MKKKTIAMIPYLITIILLFYVLPLIIRDTGCAIFVLLIGIPVGCFVTALIYGIRHSFNIFYVVLVVLLFVPTIYIYYNFTATFYSYIFGVITLIGNGIGSGIYYLIHKKANSSLHHSD